MKIYFKNIVFTKTPLKSHYRFKDYFQIYPIDLEKSPQNKTAKHFPCILEFWVDEKEIAHINAMGSEIVDNMISKTTFQTNRLIEITNLLSSITNYRFFQYRNTEGLWSMPSPENISDELNNISSEWSIGLYYYPNMADDFKIKEFTNLDFTTSSFIPKKVYYWYDPVENPDKAIDFPDLIDLAIENYLQLSRKEKVVCDSAIYQLCNGLDLQPTMRSLSFVSIVSSIETLVNYEFKNEKIEYSCSDCKSLKSSTRTCKKCGEPIWGIAAKFREFLFKYVSSDKAAKKMYNSIYTTRSKIAHTDFLISGDNYLNWNYDDKTEELEMQHLQAIQLSRRSISSWLTNRSQQK